MDRGISTLNKECRNLAILESTAHVKRTLNKPLLACLRGVIQKSKHSHAPTSTHLDRSKTIKVITKMLLDIIFFFLVKVYDYDI